MRSNFFVRSQKQQIRLAQIEFRKKNYDQSLAYWNAILERHPEHPLALRGKFDSLLRLDELSEMLTVGERACEVNPESSATHNNFAVLLFRHQRFDQAIPYFKQALSINPDAVHSLYNLGICYFKLEHFDDAIRTLERVIELDPSHLRALDYLSHSYYFAGEIEQAVTLIERILLMRPRGLFTLARYNQLLNSVKGISDEEKRINHGLWVNQYQPQANRPIDPKLAQLNPLDHWDKSRPLKVAWLFNATSVALAKRMVTPLCEALLAHNIESHFYITTPLSEDEEFELSQKVSMIQHIGDTRPAQMIKNLRSNQTDVVIDLISHNGDNGTALTAVRTAPIQLSWLSATTDNMLKTIDGRIVSATIGNWLDQQEAVVTIEKRYELAHSLPSQANSSMDLHSEKNGFITYASCAPAHKLSEETLTLWGEIMQSNENNRLLISNSASKLEFFQRRIHKQLSAHGIAAERISFASYDDAQPLNGVPDQVDVLLDSYPFSDPLSVQEAVNFGIPAITLSGETETSQHSASFLSDNNLANSVASKSVDYVKLANKVGKSSASLKTARNGISKALAKPKAADMNAFAQHFSDSLQKIIKDVVARRQA